MRATVETATVVVADPAPATLFALYAQPVWGALVATAGLVIAAMFFLRLARGRAFTKGAAVLAFTGAGLVTVGWFGSTMLTNMTTNGAMSALSDYTYEAVTFEVGFAPVVAERDMTLTALSEAVGVSVVNLSVLKNDRAKAIRFSTLTAICEVLECEVGDVLVRASQPPAP